MAEGTCLLTAGCCHDLTGAWVLRHVAYPQGGEQHYSMQGDGDKVTVTEWLKQQDKELKITAFRRFTLVAE